MPANTGTTSPGQHRLAAADVVLSPAKAAMFSLRTQEKLDAERNQDSSRQILWKNLNDRKKSGRMVRRIYNKTRCEFWFAHKNADLIVD